MSSTLNDMLMNLSSSCNETVANDIKEKEFLLKESSRDKHGSFLQATSPHQNLPVFGGPSCCISLDESLLHNSSFKIPLKKETTQNFISLSSQSSSSSTSPPMTQKLNSITLSDSNDIYTAFEKEKKTVGAAEFNQVNLNHDSNENNLSFLKLFTKSIVGYYTRSDPQYNYSNRSNPKRVLTKPSKGVKNFGYDNENNDYVLCVGELLGNDEGRKYLILDSLGHGTFGQVVKAQNIQSKELVAVKVIKNQQAYFNQSMTEVEVLDILNKRFDPGDRRNIVRMKDTFMFRKHLCIVVELLSVNLYELIKQNNFRGFSLQLIQIFLAQILDGLSLLAEAKIIHCDLKPENILLKNLESPKIKIIDFGSACHEHQPLYTYIQSRFYRSPEVLLGIPYSSAIDMWSLGCIAAELFLGKPIFPGASNYDQVYKIVEALGIPPLYMLEKGKNVSAYFYRSFSSQIDSSGRHRPVYSLKPVDVYMKEQKVSEPPMKRYFEFSKLSDIMRNHPVGGSKSTLKSPEIPSSRRFAFHGDSQKEILPPTSNENLECFLDFVTKCLNMNPLERLSPIQARRHPFITGEKFWKRNVAVPVQGKAQTARSTTTRPRASTITTLATQDVPPQFQRLAEMKVGNSQPGLKERDYASNRIIPGGTASTSEHGREEEGGENDDETTNEQEYMDFILEVDKGKTEIEEEDEEDEDLLNEPNTANATTSYSHHHHPTAYIKQRRVSNPANYYYNTSQTQLSMQHHLLQQQKPSFSSSSKKASSSSYSSLSKSLGEDSSISPSLNTIMNSARLQQKASSSSNSSRRGSLPMNSTLTQNNGRRHSSSAAAANTPTSFNNCNNNNNSRRSSVSSSSITYSGGVGSGSKGRSPMMKTISLASNLNSLEPSNSSSTLSEPLFDTDENGFINEFDLPNKTSFLLSTKSPPFMGTLSEETEPPLSPTKSENITDNNSKNYHHIKQQQQQQQQRLRREKKAGN